MRYSIECGPLARESKNIERATWRTLHFLEKYKKECKVYSQGELVGEFLMGVSRYEIMRTLIAFEANYKKRKRKEVAKKIRDNFLKANPNHFRDLIKKRWGKREKHLQ